MAAITQEGGFPAAIPPGQSPPIFGWGVPVWTEECFVKMIRTGISPLTDQTLQPPMPIHLLQQRTQDETIALWKYLKTLN
jgi:hypothetical protein